MCVRVCAHIMYLSVFGYWDDGKGRWTKLHQRRTGEDVTPDGPAGGSQEPSGGNRMSPVVDCRGDNASRRYSTGRRNNESPDRGGEDRWPFLHAKPPTERHLVCRVWDYREQGCIEDTSLVTAARRGHRKGPPPQWSSRWSPSMRFGAEVTSAMSRLCPHVALPSVCALPAQPPGPVPGTKDKVNCLQRLH